MHVKCCKKHKNLARQEIVLLPRPYTRYRRIAKTTRHCIKNSMLMISVIFKILLNSIVCFLHISSSYFRVRGIIKVVVFSRFYGIYFIILDSGIHSEVWVWVDKIDTTKAITLIQLQISLHFIRFSCGQFFIL